MGGLGEARGCGLGGFDDVDGTLPAELARQRRSSSSTVGWVASARPADAGSADSMTWMEHCPPSLRASVAAAVQPVMPPPTMAIRLILRSASITP